ncbi:MAG: formimidoylglutamate deiminase [bacterium]
MTSLFAPHALIGSHWKSNVLITIQDGIISHLQDNISLHQLPDKCQRLAGPLVPGMSNVHSHAFQYAMSGFAQSVTSGYQDDNFWSWRTHMYQLAQRMTPEFLTAIAQQLYVQMLKGGFTSVAEFHYLHHQDGAQHYPYPSEMSHSILNAATQSGIALTLLPVLYSWADFGRKPLAQNQQRFNNCFDDWLTLIDQIKPHTEQQQIGLALHSLRAVDIEQVSMADSISRQRNNCPVHIHIAEQPAEIQSCLNYCQQRPVEYLLNNVDIDQRWCLIHTTHVNADELNGIARKGAIAGICPTTEADLGDGIFPATEFIQQKGALSLGTDSHVNTHVPGELRLLEWSQRLRSHKRLQLVIDQNQSLGTGLYAHLCHHGARATGRQSGEICIGKRADLVVLDAQHPLLVEKTPQALFDSWLFSGDASQVSDVMVAGDWKIIQGQHKDELSILNSYRKTMQALWR